MFRFSGRFIVFNALYFLIKEAKDTDERNILCFDGLVVKSVKIVAFHVLVTI